jgi:hypothetical protein
MKAEIAVKKVRNKKLSYACLKYLRKQMINFRSNDRSLCQDSSPDYPDYRQMPTAAL